MFDMDFDGLKVLLLVIIEIFDGIILVNIMW